MKKVITMIVIMLVMSMMIPNCALAQSYEEADNAVIEELIDLGFKFDKDTGLWILEADEVFDCGKKNVVSASYNLITNSGNMIDQEYEKDEGDYELIITYNIDFKWYQEEEDFGIIKCIIEANKFVNDITF